MSIKKGTTNIAKIKKGTVGISKAYKGTTLVFEEERPLWVLASGSWGDGWWTSEDGGNYTRINDTTTTYDAFTYYKNYIYAAYTPAGGYGSDDLRKFNIEDVRNGITTYTTTSKLTGTAGTAPYDIATDGQSVIVVTLNGSGTLCYSLDGGDTWTRISASSSTVRLQYIGDGRFVFVKKGNDRGGLADGKYKYWSKSNPTTIYQSTYKLPDNSYPRNGEAEWLNNIWYCNGIYYFSTTDGVYYGTTRTQAQGKLSVDGLSSFTYCYNKYFALGTKRF